MRSIVAAVAVWLAPCASAPAQDYPTRTVRIIIPLGPGGGVDVFTRALADELQKALRQPVVVENRTGGALNIGTRACAEAPPDGYTICVLSSEPVIYNQFLFKSLPFDPDKDFAPISNLFFNTLALVANNSLKVRTIPDLVALAKAPPRHAQLRHVFVSARAFHGEAEEGDGRRYRAGPVQERQRSGYRRPVRIDPGCHSRAVQHGPAAAERPITGLVVLSKARSPLFPDVPTLAEARNGESYPSTWFGLFAPAGTPKPIIARLAIEVARIVEERDFRQRMFIDRAVEPADARLDDFARFIRDERKVAERIVAESGLKPE